MICAFQIFQIFLAFESRQCFYLHYGRISYTSHPRVVPGRRLRISDSLPATSSILEKPGEDPALSSRGRQLSAPAIDRPQPQKALFKFKKIFLFQNAF